MKDDATYLQHIREGILAVRAYTRSGRAAFAADRMIQKAVLRELQEIAESTQRLSKEACAAEPDVPWRDISAFRNVLVHGYLGLNLERVWSVVEHDLAPLHEAVERMLRRVPAQP